METSRNHSSGDSNWSGLRFLIGGHEKALAGLAICSILTGIAEAAILAAVAQVAAALLAGDDHITGGLGPVAVDMSMGTVLTVASILAIIRIGLQAVIAWLPARIAAKRQAQLRNDLFAAFTRSSWALQSRDRESHLQELLTSQVMQATLGTLQMATFVSALLTFGVLILSALLLNAAAAGAVVVVAFALFALLRPLSRRGQESANKLSLAQLDFAGGVGETVRLTEENRVFGVWDAKRDQIAAKVDRAQQMFFHTQLMARLVPNLFQGFLYLTVVAGLAALYAFNAGQVASLGAVVLVLIRAGTYGQALQAAYQAIRQALPFVERIRSSISRYAENQESAGDRPLSSIAAVAFSDASYSYSQETPVLSGISFEVTRGEAIGIVGPSGAGKSTLVQLLLRLRPPDRGSYLINGISADLFNPVDWHRQVAYVPQESQLIHASVAENIRYNRDLDDRSVERAAKLARIHDDILQWRDGYDAIIGPRADSVSGGQQQRICLARALAAKPAMLVLDEPTSALDPRSESLIHESLAELSREMVLFLITHRHSTLAVCDRVMVIVDGHVDGFDTVDALQKGNGYFRSAAPAVGART